MQTKKRSRLAAAITLLAVVGLVVYFMPSQGIHKKDFAQSVLADNKKDVTFPATRIPRGQEPRRESLVLPLRVDPIPNPQEFLQTQDSTDNGKLILLGGEREDFYQGANDVWSTSNVSSWSLLSPNEFDIYTGSATKWNPRYYFGAAYFNSALWVLGGTESNQLYPFNFYKNDIWKSVDGVAWTHVDTDPITSGIQDAPWTGRYSFGALVFGKDLWVLGGHLGQGNFDQGSSGDLWKSSDGVAWTHVDTDPIATGTQDAPWKRQRFGSLVFKDKMWVLGGLDGTTINSQDKNDIWSSTDGIAWTHVDTDPITTGIQDAPWGVRERLAATVMNGKMYIYGGFKDGYPFVFYKDVWSSPDGVSWTQETGNTGWTTATGDETDYDFPGVAYKDNLYKMGGEYLGMASGDVWSSTDGTNWPVLASTSIAPWFERLGHQVLQVPKNFGQQNTNCVPRTSTQGATSITSTTVTINGLFAVANGCTAETYFEYADFPQAVNFTDEGELGFPFGSMPFTPHVTQGTIQGATSASLTGLTPNTVYYYRAMTKETTSGNNITTFGPLESFTTLP